VADDGVIRALSGLTTTEAENALSLSFVEVDGFDSKIIYREKIKAVRKSGLLDIVEPDPRGLEAIGGLEVLKDWIRQRKRAWSPEAKEFGLPDPKGCLLVGVPGSGKSLCAKVIGTVLGQPTVRLDIGSLFNSLVGESESRARGALRLAEAIAPCVLWIDEIDKGMAGAGGSGSGDSGVTKRVFGTFISWMQEHKRPVFMVATANDVTNLPPEFLRKGRFDEIFAVDLPTQEERKVILSIHLAAKKRDRANFDIDAVSQATNGFTGSEIESAVVQGLFRAFDEGKEMNTQHLLAAANEIVPLAVTAKEQIDGIREWARNRARFASKQPVVGENGTRRFS
jgi:SpoVK/Ycf46/Vps4 family AAA+-type ATPase